jgi:hypothetical protein
LDPINDNETLLQTHTQTPTLQPRACENDGVHHLVQAEAERGAAGFGDGDLLDEVLDAAFEG